jgi:hypothetical protein
MIGKHAASRGGCLGVPIALSMGDDAVGRANDMVG